MLQTKAPLITRQDYEGMPQGPLEGDLIMSPSPKFFHQYIVLNIARLLGNYLEDHPIGEVMVAPLDVFLSDVNIYQPDVIFVSRERLSIITDEGLEGAPDLVVEILSDSTAKFDKGSKKKIFARTGVKELWLVDPQTKSIQVFDLTRGADVPIATYDATSTFQSKLLPGLKLQGKQIFRQPKRK